jgi:glycosyltransferase involved in cell wall biosynthesis
MLGHYVREPKKLASNLKHVFQETQILARQKPDLIFERLELYLFAALVLAKIKRIPLVLEVDCPPLYEYLRFYGKDYMHIPKLPAWIEKANLRYADAAILISETLKQYYVSKGIDSDKLFVVPNAADPDRFYPRPKDPALMRRLNIEDSIVVGWAGSLFGWSGIENLTRMIRRILDERPSVRFLFVGGGESQIFFESSFPGEAGSRIVLPGQVPYNDIPNYLACMDVVLAPYPKLDFWYPSSLKLFEYMASGKAVVASAVDQITDVIQDGKNGCLFDPDNPDELTAKVLDLVDHPARRLSIGREARQTVLDNYTWDIQAAKMARIFKFALDRRHGKRT